MTAKQGLNSELGARTVVGAAKAPEKVAGDADGNRFVIRAYLYFIVRVKHGLWKTRGGAEASPRASALGLVMSPLSGLWCAEGRALTKNLSRKRRAAAFLGHCDGGSAEVYGGTAGLGLDDDLRRDRAAAAAASSCAGTAAAGTA